jgi:4-hydroxybenzoate polyprenyltransferase
MNLIRAWLELLRPKQWVKNAFVLAGVVFGHAWDDPQLLTAALAATAAFCLGSGAVYAFNDSREAAQDRAHPDKRNRPVARGAVSPGAAQALAAAAAAAGVGLALWADWRVAAILGAYLVLNVAYTLGLKHVAVLDVFVIAAGFMLRLLAGTSGIGIAPSSWLLACGVLLTLFLGFAKRRAELERLAGNSGEHRAALAAYSVAFLDKAITLCAAGMLASYALYTLAEDTARVHGGAELVLTLPWVLLGTLRYLYRLHFRGGGGDPANELFRDPTLASAVLGWIATVLWLIA